LQDADLSPELVAQYKCRPVCTSGEMLARLLFPDFEEWRAYRDQVVGGGHDAEAGAEADVGE
jgi:hypothetical protein